MNLDEYIERLLAGDEEACLAEGRARAVDLNGLRSLYLDLIGPSQVRIGELWEAGEISVGSEHLVTAINRFVATACYAPLAHATTGGPRALIACTLDELHDLGARMLADLLECDGWNVDFYGPTMPLHDLLGEVRDRQPRVIGLSTALVIHLGQVKRTIDALRREFGAQTPPIIVGGRAYQDDDQMWRQVGADLYAEDALEAVALVLPLGEFSSTSS